MIIAGSRLRIMHHKIKQLILNVGKMKYQCAACDALYSRTSDLRIHIEAKHFTPGYKCDYCDRPYRIYSTMKKHMKRCYATADQYQ